MAILIKYLSNYPPAVQALYSAVASLLALMPVIIRSPVAVLSTRRPVMMAVRSGLSALGVVLYYFSFHILPLADANAVAFTRSLWIAPLAAVLLRERVRAHCWIALGIGFIGILLMAVPTGSVQSLAGYLTGLASAVVLALAVTNIKILTRTDSPLTIIAWGGVFNIVILLPFAAWEWVWPSPTDFGLLALLGMFSVITQFSYIKGMSTGDAVSMAVVDYSRIIFAVLSGYLVFGEAPTVLALAGTCAIVVAAYLAIRPSRPVSTRQEMA